uniref:tRNA (32-2'-O)-methyltransferase regulator THADA n=1 Tax=Haemonchus contortus TaxID=6289 RepID=W6NRG8_HAECO
MDVDKNIELTKNDLVMATHTNSDDAPPSMDFLFTKVSPSILDSVGEYPCFLVDYCLHHYLEESKKTGGVTKDVIFHSMVIKRIMTIIQDFSYSLKPETQHLIIDYVFQSWDFSADVVCHEAVDIFSMVLSNHSLQCADCKMKKGCVWTDSLVMQILQGESECRSKYKCFLILLQTHSTYTRFMDELLLGKLYSLIGSPTLSAVICDILSFDLVETPDRWHTHVNLTLSCLSSESREVQNAVRDRLLPKLVRVKLLKEEFLPLLIEEMKGKSLQFQCLYSLLCVTRFLIISHKKCDSYKFWNDYVPYDAMRYAVLHCDVQVRLAAWMLLCEHPQRTHAFSIDDLQLIQVFVKTNMLEQTPAIRQKIIAGFRQVLCRVAETSEQILKGKSGNAEQVKVCNDFIRSILSISYKSLSNGANFCRRIMALSLLQCIYVEDTMRPNGKTLFLKQLNLYDTITPHQFAALVSCLDDSFQLCQTTALDILKNLPVVKGFDFVSFKSETIEMMKSIRSHNTLATGYRMQFFISCHPTSMEELLEFFVSVCEENTKAAEKNLLNITCYSIHPWMNAIALLLEETSFSNLSAKDREWWIPFLRQRLVPLCFEVAAVVTPAVHSMSPEGFVPDDALKNLAISSANGNSIHLAAEVSQLLLVCCWRAHKHVSAILSWAVVKLCPLSILTPEHVHRIGAFYWLQLTECKHCGAFETAVEGFSSLCTYLWKSDDPSMPKPMEWLREILNALDGKKDSQNLCSTRRSAGVPHLVTTILATEPPNHASQSLKIALKSLLEMSHKSVTYRVHSLNVLRAIFSSAALGDRVTAALEWACRVAVDGCSAATWPERNAAAQLAAALRTRIFGVAHKSQRDLQVDSKNRQSSYEFFTRFPSLYSYLFDQLRTPKDEFSVYPILIFLTHLFPSNAGVTATVGTNAKKTGLGFPLQPFVFALLRVLLWCRAEKLRRLAVAALIAIATPKDILLLLDWIESTDFSEIRQNHINAVLLLMTSILESCKRHEVMDNVRPIMAKLASSAIWLKWCDMNKNLFLLLCNELGVTYSTTLDNEDLVLSKRPLACRILEDGIMCERLSSDLDLRLEIYRCLRLGGTPNNFFTFMRDFAVEDLRSGTNERDIACILEVLYICREFLATKRHEIAALVLRRIAEEWRMPETIALAYRLLVFLSCEGQPSCEELEWIESCVNMEEELPKQIALEVGAHHLKKGDGNRLVPALASFLQDDYLHIREKASSILSRHILKKDLLLNPYVCYRLIIDKIPDSGGEVTKEVQNVIDDSAEVLFDACSTNPYAETRVFGNFDEVKSMVAEMIGSH